jgi:hypothetical protein
MFGKANPPKPNAPDLTQPLQCFFCSKGQDEVKKLIAGPAVFICDECVGVCVDIMTSDEQWEVREEGDRLRKEIREEGERLRARAAALRRDSGACTLCGKLVLIERLLPVGSRGSLCGECANAVEDALTPGKPINEGAV